MWFIQVDVNCFYPDRHRLRKATTCGKRELQIQQQALSSKDSFSLIIKLINKYFYILFKVRGLEKKDSY